MNASKVSSRPSLPPTLVLDIPKAQLYYEENESPSPRVSNGTSRQLSNDNYGNIKAEKGVKRGHQVELSSCGQWSAGNASKRSRQDEEHPSIVPIEIKNLQEDVAGCFVTGNLDTMRAKDQQEGSQTFVGYKVAEKEDDRSTEKARMTPDRGVARPGSKVKEEEIHKTQYPHSQHQAKECVVGARNARNLDGDFSGVPLHIFVPRHCGYFPLNSDGSLSSDESICSETQPIEGRLFRYRHDLANLRNSTMHPPGEVMDEFEETLCFVEQTVERSKNSRLAKEMLKQLNFSAALKEQWELLLNVAGDALVAVPPKVDKHVAGSGSANTDEKAWAEQEKKESQALHRNEKDKAYCGVVKDIDKAVRIKPTPTDLTRDEI